jgi:hypothetical protein
LIKYSGGMIPNERTANYILIGISIIAILCSIFLVLGRESAPPPPTHPYYGAPTSTQ